MGLPGWLRLPLIGRRRDPNLQKALKAARELGYAYVRQEAQEQALAARRLNAALEEAAGDIPFPLQGIVGRLKDYGDVPQSTLDNLDPQNHGGRGPEW